MNSQAYRVIFSKASNTLIPGIFNGEGYIAVAEVVASLGKTKSVCAVSTDSKKVSLRFTMLGVLVSALFGSVNVVHAQMVAYKNGAGPRPTIDQSANGRTVVQIVAPNARGLSHNRYDQFNVDKNGVILNNSSSTTSTRLAGMILANPNYAPNTSAKVILNEVMSTNRSYLNGYIEVAGTKADVIVANPNGISVSGVGFFNASRAVLTTGTPTLGGDGGLSGFRVGKGDIAVGAGGLDGTGMSQLDLIARSVQVNEKLWADRLNIVVGSNQVNYADLGVQIIAGDTNKPTVGIDSSALGGMYANKIVLIGTEAGVGVKALGTISASAGDIHINNRGQISLHGQTNAKGAIQLNSESGVNNTGTLYGQQNVNIASAGQVINSGTLAAFRDLNINASSIHSTGVLGAGINAAGQAAGVGNLNLTSSGLITATGQNIAGNDITIIGSVVDFSDGSVSGNTSANGDITVTATTGNIDNSGATLQSGSSTILTAANAILNNDGTINANQLKIQSATLSNIAGSLIQSGSGNTQISTTGRFDNTNGKLTSNGQNVQLRTGSINNQSGNISHAGNGTLSVKTGALNNTNGKLISNGQINVNAATINNQRGQMIANRNAHYSVTGDINNAQGIIQSAQGMLINVNNIDNTGGAITSLSEDGLILNTDGTITNAKSGQAQEGGLIGGNGDVTLRAKNFNNNQQGQVIAAGDLNLDVTNSVNNTQGSLYAAKNLAMRQAAANLINQQGKINAAGNIALTVANINNRGGQIASSGNSNVANVNDDTGHIVLNVANQIDNTDGLMASRNDLTMQARSLLGNGRVLAGQDANINLQGDYVFTANTIFRSNRDFTFNTTGTITNTTNLESVRNLTLNAYNITNLYGALINAGFGNTNLNAIQSIYNLGRVYGNDIAIQANTLTNDGNMVQTGVIAARNDIDIGANTIINREGAVIQSLNNIRVGGALDANRRAIGQAAYLQNASATIDAGTNLVLQTAQLDNLNNHFATEQRIDSKKRVRFYMIDGDPTIYYEGIDAHIVNEDDIDKLVVNGVRYNDYTLFDALETREHTEVISSKPGKLIAGGQMILSGQINNDKSEIIAGGDITGDLSGLTNHDAIGTTLVTWGGDGEDCVGLPGMEVCTPRSYMQYHTTSDGWGGRDDEHGPKQLYKDSYPTAQNLNIAFEKANQNPEHGENGAIGIIVDGITIPTGPNGEPVSGNPQTIGTVNEPIPNLKIPGNQLFPVTTNPSANYLIETDPKFTNYHNFLSSDYLLGRLGINPQQEQKRLGDGFYEQKLINDQIMQLTGKRFVGDFTTNEQQYQALMESGITMAEQFQLKPGIALTASQMAALTSDMVWLVSQEVTMPDGTKNKVLVPVVYLAKANTAEVQPTGSVISGRNIELAVNGTLQNGGTMQSTNNTLIHATDINNTGNLISDATKGSTVLIADNDIINTGGTIAGNKVGLLAGRDVIITTTLSESKTSIGTDQKGFKSEHAIIDQVASINAGQLSIQSGRDVTLNATNVNTEGDANIVAGRDINLGTITTKDSFSGRYDADNSLAVSRTSDVGTAITTGGNLTMSATQDINAKAAYANATGQITAAAGRDINLTTGQQQLDYAQEIKASSNNILSSTTTQSRDVQQRVQSIGSTLSGDKVSLAAGNNINVVGSNIAATNDVNVVAGNNINITISKDTAYQSYSKEESTSGMFSSGGLAVTIGSKSQSDSYQDSSTIHQGSLIGSTSGNVSLVAGGDLSIKGSDLIAQNDINLAGRNVDISHVQNELSHAEQHEMKQSGLTVSVSSPMTNVATSIGQSLQRGSEVGDSRLSNLYAVKALTTALSSYGKMSDEVGQLAKGDISSISVNVAVGSSQSKSSSESKLSYVQGSQVRAGGNLNIVASGNPNDPNQGNITMTGSELSGNNVLLTATNDVVLKSAQSIHSNQSENDSSGWSAGVGVSLGEKTSLAFSANAYQGDGNQNGGSIQQVNSQINADNQLIIVSGRDTTLQGAVANAKQISADVGRNLTITSMQDTEAYNARQQNTSVGGSVGLSPTSVISATATFSHNQSNTDADYASVNQQSGFSAGEGGFNINVGNHTQLNGGIIGSTATTDKNTLNTASLGAVDITNHKSIDSQANSVGISVGTDLSAMFEMGKSAAGALLASAGESGSETSQTRATISNGNVVIKNGDTTALDNLNRDATDANNALQNYDVQKIAQNTQNSSEAGQVIADIGGQIADAVKQSVSGGGSKVYRAVCKQEPCAYDPNIQIDPNRRDAEGNPNVVMMELTEQDLLNMPEEERKRVVIATNGIVNDVQRAGELALQNADANDDGIRDNTGNSKPDVILVTSPHSGNFISELLVAAYETEFTVGDKSISMGSLFGYSDASKLLADTANQVGGTIEGNSRGSLVVNNALRILADQGIKNDALKIQVNGPAVTEEQITATARSLRTSDKIAQENQPEYNAFPNDPVPTFIGRNKNGDIWGSLFNIPSVIFTSNSPHGCGGTGAVGCDTIAKPYGYGTTNPADLQKLREAQVNNWLQQGTLFAPGVKPENGLLPSPIYFHRVPTWGVGASPVVTNVSADERVKQLRTSLQK